MVGRRDCDVILSGDPTVSRKHAELTMSHAEANLVRIYLFIIMRFLSLPIAGISSYYKMNGYFSMNPT